MPNWCQNTLHVSGPEKSISLFAANACGKHTSYNFSAPLSQGKWPVHDHVRMSALAKDPAPKFGEEHDLCLNSLYPVPKDYRRFAFDDNMARKIGEIIGEKRDFGGYRWQSTMWGTKWDVRGELTEVHPSYLQYRFDSAWSPPISAFDKIAKDYPDLTFELVYHESGMGYAGRSSWSDEDYCEEELDISEFEWDEEE